MLQRMQTVHLLIVVALMAVMFFPNYATVKLGSALPEGTSESVAADGTITRVKSRSACGVFTRTARKCCRPRIWRSW